MKGKFTFKKVITFFTIVALAIILLACSLFKTKKDVSGLNASETDKRSVTYKDVYSGVETTININNPYLRNTTNNFGVAGADIAKKAAELQGAHYHFGKKGAGLSAETLTSCKDQSHKYIGGANEYSPFCYGIDCSGLVQWSLKNVGITKVEGLNSAVTWGPNDCLHWVIDSNGRYFKEAGQWTTNNHNYPLEWKAMDSSAPNSIYNRDVKYTYNNNTYNINVLKVNDPIIPGQFEYYNYYDGNVKKELPIGTVIISMGTFEGCKYDHAWITLGNLGTADINQAAKNLKDWYGIEVNTKYMESDGKSHYWRIESSGTSGSWGVRINNYTPTLKDVSNQKGIGPIWAFQFGKYIEPTNYNVKMAKVDADNNKKYVSGVTLTFQDRPNSAPNTVVFKDYTSEDKAISVVSNREINNTTMDIYVFGEKNAEDAGYVNRGGTYGLQVHKMIDNSTVPPKYKISKLLYYSGVESKGTLKTGEITETGTYWITSSRDLKKDSDMKDEEKKDSIAFIYYDAASATPTITYTAVNKKIEGTYNLNLLKKPDGPSHDEDEDDKQNAMEGAGFTVKQYLNTNSDEFSEDKLSSLGRNGDNVDKVVTKFTQDDKGREERLTRISFAQRDANGNIIQENGADKYDAKVNIFNTSKTDIYTIDEIEAPPGTTKDWEHGEIKLIVSKKAINTDGKVVYGVSAVTIVANGKSNTLTIPAQGSGWLRIDKNGDVTTDVDNYAIAIGAHKASVTVTWRNPVDTKGEYNINIKKIDAKTKKAIPGIAFDINGVSKVTEDTGIAQYDPVTIDKNNVGTTDSYTVKEDLGETYKNKYYKINDFTFEVTKKYIESTKEYKVSEIKFNGKTGTSVSDTVKDESGRNVPIEISVDDNTNTITIEAENNESIPGKFYLKKTDIYGQGNLGDTTFKIDKYEVEDYIKMELKNPVTKLNGKLSTIDNGLIDDIRSMKGSPCAYVYDIHETTAQAGYINAFKKVVNGSEVELAYIRLVIRNNENDELVATQEIIKTNECTDEEYNNILNFVKEPTVNKNTRAVTLNIKNPNTSVNVNLRKYKYNTVTNARGGTYKVEFDNETIDSTNFYNSGSQWIHKTKVPVGDHTIRVYELTAPQGLDNVFDQFSGVDGVKVDFTVNYDGTVSIKENTIRGKKYNYTPESKEHVVDTSKIEDISNYVVVKEFEGQIYITISDPTHYEFELFKKEYTGKDDISQEEKLKGVANFTIKKIKPTEDENPIFNGNLPTDTQTKLFKEENVKVNSTYVYDVTENNISDGYYRNLIGKKIRVTVSVDANGDVYKTTTGKTKYEIFNADGSAISADEKKALDEFVKLDVDNNGKVNLYIANMPTTGYRVRIYKVDKDGNAFKRTAVFKSVMTTNTTNVDINETRENITTNPSTGIAYVTNGTKLVERGATHTYEIEETQAPAGCKLPNGTFKLNVKFNNNVTGNVIENATVEFYNASGIKEIIDGLSVKYNQGGTSTPIVTVYIPNEGNDFEVELKKVDSLGKTIEATTDESTGRYDGVSFNIRRGEIRENSGPIDNPTDFGKMIEQIKADIENKGSFNGILENGVYTDKLPLGENLIYTYYITETSTKKGYSNELENKQINMFIYTKKGTDSKPYIDKVNFEILDLMNPANPNVTSQYEKYISYTLNEDKTKVNLILTNPNTYKIRLNKTDLAGNPIDSAVLEAYKDDKRITGLNQYYNPGTQRYEERLGDSSVTSDYIGISKGEEQVWKIYERSVAVPYYNIFGTDKYVEVKVKMYDNGEIKVTGYTVKDRDGKEYSNLKSYIEQVNIITEDSGDKIVNVTFKNPSGYKLKITKYKGDGTTPLEGATVVLDGTEVISNGSYHYENNYQAGINSSKTFTITETKTAGENYVNVLEGKKLELTVKSDKNGNISRSFKIMSGNNEIMPPDEVFDYVTVSDVEYENDIPVINVKILNPVKGKFNVKLYKVDEKGNLIKNYPATFFVFKNTGKLNPSQKYIETLNGVATVDMNAPINKVDDTYRYQINETEAPLGYEVFDKRITLDPYFKDDETKLTIDETKTKLYIGSHAVPQSDSDGQFNNRETGAWYIDNSGDTVTIKIYIKNKQKVFDLALRKYIAKVENGNKNETPDPSRKPFLNELSHLQWVKEHTAAYYHTKEAYKVEYGDIVTYRIYVYNEGNVKGYATEITDYLESGLDFVDNEFNKEYGWTATKNNDGTTTVTTRYLENKRLDEYALPGHILGQASAESWRNYVEIQCKVTRSATKERSYITDRAEITEDKAIEIKNNEEVPIELEDIDSDPKNVKDKYANVMLKYDSSITYSKNEFYRGYEDDDDKETVYIEKHEYEFILSKTDGNNEISGAQFKIEELMDDGKYKQIYSGAINKNKTISEPAARGDSTVELNKTYTYKITETATKDSNYENLLEGKYLVVKTYLDDNNGNICVGDYSNFDTLDYFNLYGFEIRNISDNSLVSDIDSNLYSKIKVEPINDSNPPAIKVTIPNERLYSGKYKIDLKKIDSSTSNKIEGIPFSINNKYIETDELGMINISRYNSYANSNGVVSIDKNNKDIVDRYTIQEYVDFSDDGISSTSKYIPLKDDIYINVRKDLDTLNEQYFVSNIEVQYNGNETLNIPLENVKSSTERTINLKTIDNKTVQATISVEPYGVISIIAQNPPKEGNYKLRLYKVDEKNQPVSGIKFGITGESAALSTDANGYTRTITKEITADNVNTPDEYTITEYEDEQGRVIGIKNPIKLTVNKENTFNKYTFKSLKLTETGTGAEGQEAWQSDLNNVEINDDSGRKVTVTAVYESSTNTITVTFANPPVEDDINVKIKKINSKDGSAINGITFSRRVNQGPYESITTQTIDGEQGIAYLDKDRKVSKVENYNYFIRETGIPSTPEGLIQLKDIEWRLSFTTKYDESKGRYVINPSTVKVISGAYGGEATAKIQEIASRAKAEVKDDGTTVVITIENEQTTRYGLSIRKADFDTNSEIADAKFTIKKDGKTVGEENQTLAELAGRLANQTGVYVNSTHTYEIYETSPAAGYDNILEKTYIELVIKIDKSGDATATYTIKPQVGASSTDVAEVNAKIREYVNKHSSISSFLEKDGNNFKLNIPNQKATLIVSADLIKFETGDPDVRVNRARFSVRKTTFDDAASASVESAIGRFDNNQNVENLTGIVTAAYAINWIDREFEATCGDVYYYELTETAVPANYKEEFHSAIIKMYVERAGSNNVARASIVKVKKTADSEWEDYSENDFKDKLSLEVDGTSIHVKWANELSYKLRLIKKSYKNALPEGGPSAIEQGAGGAEFKIVSSNSGTLVDGMIHETEMYEENDIHSNKTYEYIINEKAAPFSPTNHYNIFEDVDIIVNVRVGANGKISANNSTIDVRASEGKTVSEEKLLEARNNLDLKVDTANNMVDVYVANKQVLNTYDIKIMKVSDKKETDPVTGEQRYKGIPGIKFSLVGNWQQTLGEGITGEDGTVTIAGLEPNDFYNNYGISEDMTSAINAGTTPLHEMIYFKTDMTGIRSDMDEDVIEALLNEKNPDGTSKRFSLELSTRDAAMGATVNVEGRTIIIKLVNHTTDVEFNLSKVDPAGTRIARSEVDGKVINGASFKIVNSKANPDQELWDDELIIGGYTKRTHANQNAWYEYTVRENSSKVGFINVTQGYDIQVHIQTDLQGKVINPAEDSRTFVRLLPNGLEEPLYSINEILSNNWVKLVVSYTYETDIDTGEEVVSVSHVTLLVVNPYEYKVQLNKKDKNGSTPLKVSNIKAEHIVGADVAKIYNHGTPDDRAMVLNQIANATTNTTAVKVVDDPVELNKVETTTSEDGYLIDLQGRYAEYDENQTWRISETDVDAPYMNILKDKYIIVNTYYNDMLQLAKHGDYTDNQAYNFYVIDKEGNDVTTQYLDYIEVSAENIEGQWTVVVTVKDPMIIRMGLFKKVDSFIDEPLQGANLKLTLGSQTAEIKNGSYQTEMLETELAINSTVTATIEETSTVKGYTNILNGKKLYYIFRNGNGDITVVARFLVDSEGHMITSGDEYRYIMSHIDLRKSTDSEGFTSYKLYIENPMSFKFDLTKLDIDKNNLDGTKIKVVSSHSGEHILDGDSNLSFIEQDVTEHDIIEYKITEIHTKDGAYVNKFEYPIRIVATVGGGEVKITEKWHQVLLPNGSAPMEKFDELEYFDIYVDPADKNKLADGEMQTLTIKMENPPQIEVELIKSSAGRYGRRLPNTKFTIVSQDTHTEYTDNQGEISYLEEIHEPGNYTIRVYEDEAPGPKYVNILENKYMQFDINVTADGTITVDNDSIKFFKKDNDSYFDNDVEITGDEATLLSGYCSVWADNSEEISKVITSITDPIKYDIKLEKDAMDGTTLEGAEFEIVSTNGLFETIHTTTNELGEIAKRIEIARPGIHGFKITEIKPAGNQYDNILGDNVVLVYARALENGEISLVQTPYGGEFGNDIPEGQQYVVQKPDGAPAEAEDEARIRNFVSIALSHPENEPDEIAITIKNPVQTKLDIVKRQYNIEGQEEVLTNTRFTVMKNGSEMLLNNAIVNEEVEIEEHDLSDSADYYDIYENSTNTTDGAYVNILNGKFIRVHTELKANGKLNITDEEGNVTNTFDIYQVNHFGPATKVAREGNEELYDSVEVWVSKNTDGIYVLNVKVVNPITIEVGVIKKQYGDGAQPIPDVSITITSDNTGDHNITSTRSEEVFSEGNIKPGTYNFIVRENDNPNPRYVNVLKDRYAKANVTISKTGDITLNNIKYYTNNNVEIVDPEIKALLEETVYADIDKSGRIQKITFIIENPITLKFLVHKVDLAGNGLEGATFNVMKYVGDSDKVVKGMTSVDTNNDGVITFEDGDYMKAGIYRYEITELKPAAEKYVNILDCYDDKNQYKVVMYLKLNLNGTTEYVKDAQGTAFPNAGSTPYTIVNRNDKNAEVPAEVTELVHKYLNVGKTASKGNNPDVFEVEVTNTPQIDIDIIKVTKDTDTNTEKTLAGTKFSAEADGRKALFEDIQVTQDKEYTFKNITSGRHEFYITESQGVAEKGYINVLENRYVRVRTTVDEAGVMKIMNNNWEEDANYFEIYDGQYNSRYGSKLLDRTEYAKIYECVSVESVKQANGVYKLNLKVNNPERNYNIKLNKKVFGEEDINMKGIEFFIRSTVDNENHQLTTDKDGNLTFEEKRVPVGIYEYRVTETKTSGPEFVNVLENNWILVRLKVNQDGSIEIVDTNNEAEGNENRYYILNDKCTEIINNNSTIVDDFVRVATDNEGDEPELDFFIKDPERYSFRLVKKEVMTKPYSDEVVSQTNLNGVTFTTTVYGPNNQTIELLDADTFNKLDIATVVTKHMTKEEMNEQTHSEETDNEDGMDGVIMIPNILIDKTGTYTFVFHEESTDGLFKYLYKSHAEDITIKVDISVEKDNSGRPIGYKVGEPTVVTGAKYVDAEKTLTELRKAQVVKTEVINTPIRGNFDLVLNKLDKYTNRRLDGAEFDIKAEKNGEKYELYEDADDLNTENAIIPDHFTVQNGEIRIENIRITPPPYQAPAADGTLETFNIILTETKAPAGYMLLDEPIVLEVTTAVNGEYDDAEYVIKSVNLVSGDNYGLVTKTFGKNEINVVAKDEYFDLALRKSIVSVAYSDSDEAKITEDETKDRVPVIYEDDEIYNLNPGVTTANYRHVKNHVRVYPGQEVIYCLRVYNEGEIDGYAEKITDHLPEGLEFLPNDKFNQERGWTYDLTDQSLKTVYTTFLSKENNPNNDRFNAENNLIKAMDENVATGVNHNLDFKEIEIKCKVSDNLRPGVILTNIAEITEYKAEGRNQTTVDRDSDGGNADVPEGKNLQNYKENELTDNREDYVPGQEDDDDFEKLIVVEFDLALRKYITAINDEEVLADEKEAKYTDEVVKDTEDILGEGTASDDTEGTNEGANTNIVDESEGENDNTEDVNAQTGENPDENKDEDKESDKEDIDDDNTIKYGREPRVNVSTLKSGDQDSIYKDPDEPTTALYNHTKAPVEVSVDDIVTYTLEVFNEGTVDGYASLIKDDIPEGVEFVQYTEGDGSVNDKYRWKMVNENDEEVTDPKDAKYIVSDYLSKDNETEENGNLIRAFDPVTGTRLDSKYVQVQFRVICKQDYPKIITNYAQISDDTDDGGKSVRDRDSHTNEWIDGEDDQDVEHIWVTYMDLALRKFITGVTDFKTGITQVVDTRIPQVDPTALIDETGTTAKYEHTKEPVLVHTNDVVIYTLRIYNEGSKDGYATQIKDDLPEGLEYLPDHEINKYYEWSLVDKNDKPVTRLEDATFAVTNYLSKDNETEKRQNLLKSFDYYDYENDKPAKRETPEYKDIKIAFKVTEPQTSDRILINEAQISEQTDGKGIHREDRDSTPNEWLGEDDEDIEKVRVLYFDLALRKWVTKAIVTQDGEEKVFETGHHAEDDPEDVVKVDLKKSKINKVVVKFEYQIRITNEGEIDGYAKEIKDRIPEGLRFDPADNPTWTQLEENIIVTDELKDTLLKPGESAEVTVVLTWINSGDNLGLKVNVAEISKDYNDYGTHDIDSTPDNNVWGEDDIDDAPVMLAVKTGNAVFGYIALAVFVGAVIVIGVRRIKKVNEG